MTSAAPDQRPIGRWPPGISSRRSSCGAAILILLGAGTIGVPYLGPGLGVKLEVARRLEVIDHVVPGLVVVASSGLMLMLLRRRRTGGFLSLAAVCLSCVGGSWITATHIPLLADAGRGRVPWGTALFHIAAGPLILALSLWLVVLELREPEPRAGQSAA